jgi:ABC-2 type transport system permease protein
MIDALKFELVRMRTLRSTWWMIAAALVVEVAVSVLVGYFARHEIADQGTLDAQSIILGALTGGSGYAPLPLMGIFAAVIGAFTFGHEYFRKTITSSLAAVPRRSILVMAKTLVLVLTAVVLAVAGVALGWVAMSIASGNVIKLTSGMTPVLIGFVVQVVLMALLSMALCLLTRSLPLTMATIFVWPLIIENVLQLLFFIPALRDNRELLNYLPFAAGRRLTAIADVDRQNAAAAAQSDEPVPDQLSRVQGGLVFFVWIAVIYVSGWILFRKRDA